MGDKLLTLEDVADFLGVPLATVYAWNSKGTGPRTIRVGRHSRVKPTDLSSWVEAHADPRTPA